MKSFGVSLGLAAALFWGTSDFLARFAARRIGFYRTSFFLQGIGLAVLTALFVFTGGIEHPSLGGVAWRYWLWAVLAGILNSFCSLAFYHALEQGAVTVVAPISSSYPALTLLLSIMSGERIKWLNGLGIVGVMLGVILASTSFEQSLNQGVQQSSVGDPHKPHHLSEGHLARGVAWSIAASIGFGVMFWILGFRVVPFIGGFTSVWMIRLVSFVVLLALSSLLGISLQFPCGSTRWLLLGIGLLDTFAFLCNNFGFGNGKISEVTVLASLYSAVTVVYASIFLRERLERSQWCGIALIFAGIILINL